MTEKANPSINRPAEAYKTAGAIAYGGHGGDGFVVDGASPTDISVQDGGITEADLNTFAQTSGGASLDVTIDGGEAFVFGSWLAIDTDTTVSLAASTAGQTVYVGWNKNGADDVIVGLSGAFSSASGDTDERIPLWTFDTDGSGVTAVTDERTIGYTQEATNFTGNVSLGDNSLTDTLSVDGTNGSSIDFQFGGSNDTALETNGKDIVLYDTANSVRLLSAQEGGTIDLRANIDFLDSDSIFDNGTAAISFDGSQNVTIANGRLSADLGITADGATSAFQIEDHDFQFRDTTDSIPLAVQRTSFDGQDGTFFVSFSGAGHPPIVFRSSSTNTMIIDGGNVEIPNGELDLSGGSFMSLPQISSDPSASPGDMWYRSDLD